MTATNRKRHPATDASIKRFHLLTSGIADGLHGDDRDRFLAEIAETAPGADVDKVVNLFMLDLLEHPDGGSLRTVAEAAGLYRRENAGEKAGRREWQAVRSAARAICHASSYGDVGVGTTNADAAASVAAAAQAALCAAYAFAAAVSDDDDYFDDARDEGYRAARRWQSMRFIHHLKNA